MLPAAGKVTAKANWTAMAASTALPPFFMMSTPTWDDCHVALDTIPLSYPFGHPACEYAWNGKNKNKNKNKNSGGVLVDACLWVLIPVLDKGALM
jgi:hypothetical protein